MDHQGTTPRAGQSGSGAPSSAGASVQSAAQDTLGTAKNAASQTLDQVKEQGKNQLEGQKDRAAGAIGDVAHAMRQTGWNLRQDKRDYVAQFVDQAASQLERFSSDIRDKDVSQMLGDAENFARRQPAVFLGGAFMLGLLAARFLRSSRPQYATGSTGMSGQPASWTGTMPSALSASRESAWDLGHGSMDSSRRTGHESSEKLPFATTEPAPSTGESASARNPMGT